MSIRESIYKKSYKVKQRLFDEAVKLKGRKVQAVRIKAEEIDIFGDRNVSVISNGTIEAIISFPDRMPLERFRSDYSSTVDESRVFFFDILPIQGYTKFSDHIEKGDILAFFLEDEVGNSLPFVLEVSNMFGKFEYGLVWKMQYLAPYNGRFTNEIREYISDSFKEL